MVTVNNVDNKPDTNRTQHGIGTYGASGALTEVGPLTNGQLVIGNSGNNGSAATLASAEGTITITNGAGTINLESTVTKIIIQEVTTVTNSLVHCTTLMPVDDTIPQKTEGDEVLTLAITPTNANNLLLIEFEGTVGTYLNDPLSLIAICALFQDATANALAASWAAKVIPSSNGCLENFTIRYVMVAGTTSSTTFKIRVGPIRNGYFADINGFNNGRIYGGVAATTLTITEIKV